MAPPKVWRITFVLPNLACGGTQRAASHVMAGLAARGHHVTVITLADTRSDFFPLAPGIERLCVGMRDSAPTPLWLLPWVLPRRFMRLRQLLHSTKPDIVIAHAPDVAVRALAATRGLDFPVIVGEHGDVTIHQGFPPHRRLWRKWLWYRLRYRLYPFAAGVVSVSKAVDRNFSWLPADRRTVIYNPFFPCASRGERRPWVASTGRLSYAKGFDILIDSFARIAQRFPDWQLLILGDGELRGELLQQVERLNLSDRVIFAGAVANPADLQQASIFAMASRYEGFPNAHGEALACGLPVVATDCPSAATTSRAGPAPGGVRELVQQDVNGWLTACNAEALGAALARLMESPAERARLAAKARESVRQFSLDKILDEWEALIAATLAAQVKPMSGAFLRNSATASGVNRKAPRNSSIP